MIELALAFVLGVAIGWVNGSIWTPKFPATYEKLKEWQDIAAVKIDALKAKEAADASAPKS